MKMLLVVTHSEVVQQTVPWLAEIARHYNSELLVTNCVLNPIAVPGRVDAWLLIEDPKTVRTALNETVGRLSGDPVTLLDEINNEFPYQALSDIVQNNHIDRVYFPINAEQSPNRIRSYCVRTHSIVSAGQVSQGFVPYLCQK